MKHRRRNNNNNNYFSKSWVLLPVMLFAGLGFACWWSFSKEAFTSPPYNRQLSSSSKDDDNDDDDARDDDNDITADELAATNKSRRGSGSGNGGGSAASLSFLPAPPKGVVSQAVSQHTPKAMAVLNDEKFLSLMDQSYVTLSQAAQQAMIASSQHK